MKVGPSEAALLTKLNIRPFSYGLGIDCIFDNGSQFSTAVLDIDDYQLMSKFAFACSAVAALSLEIGYPTQASIPHSIGNAFRSLIAITVNLDEYSFEKADTYKAFLANPSAFAGPSAAAAGGSAPADAPAEAAVVEEEEDALDGGMDMFGGGGPKTGDY
jgi:large subunit ribosomal protein LP0